MNLVCDNNIQTPLRMESTVSHTGIPDATVLEQVYDLWDRLADFDATQVDDALDYLLRALCVIVGAQNADWFGTVRLLDIRPGGTLQSRCPALVRVQHPTGLSEAVIGRRSGNIQLGIVDDVVANMAAMPGRLRNYRDVIYVGSPVNDGIESCFGIFRDIGQPPFDNGERDAVAYILRGLKWFHRQLMLSHGLLVAETPLTPVERRVLKQLLGGLSEKQIAAELGHSYHTTHEYVTAIYRKFGVGNRASLIALWLGRAH